MRFPFILDRLGSKIRKSIWLVLISITASLMSSCQADLRQVAVPVAAEITQYPPGMTEAEAQTLASLVQIDDYPLYIMVYQADYSEGIKDAGSISVPPDKQAWACSLFAIFGDPGDMMFGRNFDWDFSPGLLLFTDPPAGYASVSMVDLYYLGFGAEKAFGITDLNLEQRVELLKAPYIPFDGMNEAGLAVGMAAVPGGDMDPDPEKETIDSVMVIRQILDQAATIDQAVEIVKQSNIDMQGQYLHYLVAEKSGRSALIEFSKGEVVVIPHSGAWQSATNFLLAETLEDPEAQCWRYGLISRRLSEIGAALNPGEAMALLKDLAQDTTQWSVVYRVSAGEIRIAMGGKYENIYLLEFGK